MNAVLPHLFVGGMGHSALAKLMGYAVLCVMQEAEHDVAACPASLHLETCGLDPGAVQFQASPQVMEQAADWIDACLRQGQTVYVHCAAGMERSPLTIVWYLMRHKGMTLHDAYALVLERRGEALYRGQWLPAETQVSGQLPERLLL